MAPALQHSRIQEKCIIQQKSCSCITVRALFDTSCQYFQWTCSILLLLSPVPVTWQAGNITSEIEKKERQGREEILHSPLAPSFWKSYCNTSTVASASWSPLKKKKKNPQVLPLFISLTSTGDLKAQEKEEPPSLGAPCSQSYRNGSVAPVGV